MHDYRNTLTLGDSDGKRVFILQCNKSEKKSVIKRHHNDGTFSWLSEKVATKHNDGKPKILHIAIPDEGIYQIYGQPVLSGLYCIYRALNGKLYYSGISQNEKILLIAAFNTRASIRETLLGMDKRNIF